MTIFSSMIYELSDYLWIDYDYLPHLMSMAPKPTANVYNEEYPANCIEGKISVHGKKCETEKLRQEQIEKGNNNQIAPNIDLLGGGDILYNNTHKDVHRQKQNVSDILSESQIQPGIAESGIKQTNIM